MFGNVITAVLFSGIAVAVPSGGMDGATSPERESPSWERKQDHEREQACECCAKCAAAQRQIREKDEGPPAKDGCRECCRRCGRSDMLPLREMPPEVVR